MPGKILPAHIFKAASDLDTYELTTHEYLILFRAKKASGWLEPIGAIPADAAVDLLNEFANRAFIPIALMEELILEISKEAALFLRSL